jgi:mRNA-degrading endonuclease YafQ of YafQ-DinJ toxin-antitoxin module
VNQFQKRINLFITDRKNPLLKDHGLKGKMTHMRAFSVTGDIRVVYTIIDNINYFLKY